MYFQFLIEDLSTEILINHVIEKLKAKYPDREIYADTKSFKGIGHLATHGNLMERKGGNLLNNLHMYLRGFDRSLASMKQAAIIVVLDNDKRDPEVFRQELENVAKETVKLTDCVFCVAVKEMEAWLLGDENAIWEAYPSAKKNSFEIMNKMEFVIHGKSWQIPCIQADYQNCKRNRKIVIVKLEKPSVNGQIK